MRLHRFFIPETIGGRTEITINSIELSNQLRRVFRLKTGDLLIIFDGSGSDYKCTIGRFEDNMVVLTIVSSSRSRYIPEKDVTLFAAVTKKDTFEWIVEKATELGVSHIVPVLAERSEKKNLNIERLNKIAIEASEQSGRGSVSTIGEIVDLSHALSNTDRENAVVFHTEVAGGGVQELARFLDTHKNVAVFIGPEGGWSEREMDMFHKEEMKVVSLGSQVLRAETAVVAALVKVLM